MWCLPLTHLSRLKPGSGSLPITTVPRLALARPHSGYVFTYNHTHSSSHKHGIPASLYSSLGKWRDLKPAASSFCQCRRTPGICWLGTASREATTPLVEKLTHRPPPGMQGSGAADADFDFMRVHVCTVQRSRAARKSRCDSGGRGREESSLSRSCLVSGSLCLLHTYPAAKGKKRIQSAVRRLGTHRQCYAIEYNNSVIPNSVHLE